MSTNSVIISGVKECLKLILVSTEEFVKKGLVYAALMGSQMDLIRTHWSAWVDRQKAANVKSVIRNVDSKSYSLYSWKAYCNWLNVTGKLPFGYEQGSKYVAINAGIGNFKGLTNKQLTSIGANQANMCQKLAKLDIAELPKEERLKQLATVYAIETAPKVKATTDTDEGVETVTDVVEFGNFTIGLDNTPDAKRITCKYRADEEGYAGTTAAEVAALNILLQKHGATALSALSVQTLDAYAAALSEIGVENDDTVIETPE